MNLLISRQPPTRIQQRCEVALGREGLVLFIGFKTPRHNGLGNPVSDLGTE